MVLVSKYYYYPPKYQYIPSKYTNNTQLSSSTSPVSTQ